MSRGKSKSRPTTSRRNERQKLKEKYAKTREDAQLAGIIPTTPEGALKSERTPSRDPLDGLPELVKKALRENWSTPDEAKKAIVASLLYPFFNETEIIDANGNVVNVRPSPKLLNELARTLQLLDQTQFARDNPEAAGKARGGGMTVPVAVSVEANKLAVQVLRGMFENGLGRGETALPPPLEPLPPSHSRFDGEVETGAASTEDQ